MAKWAKRRPAVAALVGIASTLLLVMLGISAWGWQQAEDKAAAQANARQAAEEKGAMEKQRAVDAERRVHGVQAHLALEKGTNRLSRGEIVPGLLWLARGLEEAPDDEIQLKQSLRRNLGSYRDAITVPRAMLPEHGFVTWVVYSPDGNTFATAGYTHDEKKGFVQRWDAQSLKEVGERMSYPVPVEVLVYHPDGNQLLVGGGKQAQIYDLKTGKVAGEPFGLKPGEDDQVSNAAFSPDGKQVALLFCQNQPVTVFDVATGKRKFILHREDRPGLVIYGMAFSPDGKSILAVDDECLQRWNAETGEPIDKPLFRYPKQKQLRHFAASANGNAVVLTYFNDFGEVAFGRAKGDGFDFHLSTQQENLNNLALSRDGRLMATSPERGVLRVWDCSGDTLEPTDCLMIHRNFSFVAKPHMANLGPWGAFSPDGKTLATANGTCLLWNIPAVKKARPFGKGRVDSVAFSPDGKFLVVGTRSNDNPAEEKALQGVQFYDRATAKPIGPPLPDSDGGHLAFSPNGKLLATTCIEEKIGDCVRLWDVKTRTAVGEVFPFPSSVSDLVFGHDGESLLVVGHAGGVDSMFRRWNVRTGKLLNEYRLPGRYWRDLRISPRGTYFFAVNNLGWKLGFRRDAPGKIEIWSVATGRPLEMPLRQQGEMGAMAFSPDEKILLTVESSQSAKQNSLRLLDLATGKSLCEPYPTDGFSQAGFARDGKTFATRLRSGLQFWETQTGKPLGQPVLPNIPIFNLVFDPTSKAVVVTTQTQGALLIPVPQTLGADAERIRLWVEVATHQELDVAGGAVDLDPKTWQQRWQRLRELGGAP